VQRVAPRDNIFIFTLTALGLYHGLEGVRVGEPGAELLLPPLGVHPLFIPYQLTHCEVEELTVWLLGASDRKVHIYSEDEAKYQDQEPGDLSPEICNSFSQAVVICLPTDLV
jgi:hypothetical protein